MEYLPHQQRVVEEKDQLKEKVEKLKGFFETDIFKGLPKQERNILKMQYHHMKLYLGILGTRIEGFTESIVYEMKGNEVIGDFGTENEDVLTIKSAAISLIDIIQELGNDPRRKAAAITDVEKAQMMAVKSLFA